MNRAATLALGAAATLAITALWHGPLGAGDRFAASVEATARAQLQRDEMGQVGARLARHPLRRELILSGPADSFQRAEIATRMSALPGVGTASWDATSLPAEVR